MSNLKCSVSKRVITGLMCFLAIAISYAMRACFSIAITEMVMPLNNTRKHNHTLMCAVDSSPAKEIHHSESVNGTRFDWNQKEQGWILSSYYMGYVITQIPAGVISQRYGGKWMLSLAILSMTVGTLLIPLVTSFGGYISLMSLRIITGLASGAIYPAITVLLAVWIPKRERTKLGSLVYGGTEVGNMFSLYISGFLLSFFPWSIVFYFWGSISIVWIIVFTLTCHKDPNSHPFISEKERSYLRKEIGQLQRSEDLPNTPWKEMLTSVPVLVLICAQMGHDWVAYGLASNLPKYFKEVLGYSVHNVGLFTSLPYLIKWIVSILSAFLCDFLINNGYLTRTKARKIFAAASGIPPAIFMIVASYAGCDRVSAVLWFTLAIGFTGNFFSGLKVNSLDLSPNYSGPLMAVTNGMSSVTGVAAPIFVNFMTPNSTLEEYRFVFWVTFILTMIRVAIFLVWGSAEVQPWNNPTKYDTNESEKLTGPNTINRIMK